MVSTSQFIIRPFDHKNATTAAYEALNSFSNRMRAEQFPDDPPIPLAEAIQEWRNMNPAFKLCEWTMQQQENTPTDVYWHPNRPELLQQGMTGVLPAYRNRGLGRWLKAAMLAKVLSDRPQIAIIRTSNADSNAAMLKINRELGFQPYLVQIEWQVTTEQVAAYLK